MCGRYTVAKDFGELIKLMGHRHGAGAVLRAALQYRADTNGAGHLSGPWQAGGEADAVGADSVLGEG